MKMEGLSSIKQLDFDLNQRMLTILHAEPSPEIEERLVELNLGARIVESGLTSSIAEQESSLNQSRLLWTVLLLNFGFFLIEMIAGFLSGSMGLVADSLDMLADAFVYGLSLWAVGAAITRKMRVARLSGYLQLFLALLGLSEVIRRFIGATPPPNFQTMMIISLLALIANSYCLYLLQQSKSQDAHMKASLIFTSNDVIINLGVIMAGALVLITGSVYPDLIVGSLVFLVVVRGALRILKLG